MYQIKCDDYILYDHRDERLTVLNPKCKLEVNTCGSASFTILSNHPYYGSLKKLKSIIEIQQDGEAIFRGRMTNDSRDFYNQLSVDLEGVLAFTNDSIINPFKWPEDYPIWSDGTNVVEAFLSCMLDEHNAQVEPWQQLKLGTVTVADPNNYITRSSDKHLSTWEVLKTKLFESSLGGYLCIRYEEDGNYVDYLSEFPLTNTQTITFGENLLNMKNDSSATETYSAILPVGKDGLTLESLEDGDLSPDLVKKGQFIYSKSAVADYGWVCVPIAESTWSDVTEAGNLQRNAMNHLSGTAMLMSNTITAKAVDLHFTDEQIQSFRIYRNVSVNSPVHGVNDATYPLLKLDIDILNPQNTDITVGSTTRTLVDINAKRENTVDVLIQHAVNTLRDFIEDTKIDIQDDLDGMEGSLQQTILDQRTAMLQDAESVMFAALEDYVETSDYEQYKQSVSNQFEMTAEQTTLQFERTESHIENVSGDLQQINEKVIKHFEFTENGLVIKAGNNAMQLLLDNDVIRFTKNGQEFGWWDGVNFHTGNIVVDVNERAQFGNFAFVPRSDGSLSFLKVGG